MLLEVVGPNGVTRLTLSVVKRRPIESVLDQSSDKEASCFVSLEHFLMDSREGAKVLYKVTSPAKREVLESLGYARLEDGKHGLQWAVHSNFFCPTRSKKQGANKGASLRDGTL